MDYEREFDPQELLMGNGEENSIILRVMLPTY